MKFSNINLDYLLKEEDVRDGNFPRFLDEISDIPSREMLGDLNEAGVINQNITIKVKNFLGSEISYLYCDLKLCVSLTKFRGIHMSRVEEALFSLVEEEFDSLESFAKILSDKLRILQDAKISLVEINAVTFVKRLTRKSEKYSHDKVNLFCSVRNEGGEPVFAKGIEAYNMTACPCTATYTKFHTVPSLQSKGFSLEDINYILSKVVTGTHTQRGRVSLVLKNLKEKDFTYEQLYLVLEESVHLVHELLKRPDEHDLVIRALKKPQFTEDVVRDIAKTFVKNLGNVLDNESIVVIESTQADSIHIHDVYSKIEQNGKDFKECYS